MIPTKTIFLGSSAAAKSQANCIIAGARDLPVSFLPWWTAFTAGTTLLPSLDVISGKVEGALLLFSQDSPATIRGSNVDIPSLNVLFELGYFYGKLGSRKVAMIKYGAFYLPTNLGGYNYIAGSKFFKRSQGVPLGKAAHAALAAWIQQV